MTTTVPIAGFTMHDGTDRAVLHRRWWLCWCFAMAATATPGCVDPLPSLETPVTLTASSIRADRRLYDGAPPVIPHPPLNIACTACHTETGKQAEPLGFAPANPHAKTKGLGATSHCVQCHLFRRGEEMLVANDFHGLQQRFAPADRLYPGAPPVIPHRIFMRENCTACHSGPAARPEIRCTHPDRVQCRQCHVPVTSTDAASLSDTAGLSSSANASGPAR